MLPNIPAKNFWSVVVYDALSRSELQNGQPLPSVSSYVNPKINADGSLDIRLQSERAARRRQLDQDRARLGVSAFCRLSGCA
jgi:hypothetical protein